MRISDNQFSQLMLNSLSMNNAGLGQVMAQMSTSNRLIKLSDDPLGSINLLNLERETSALKQYGDNIDNLKTELSNQEVHLSAVTDTLLNIRDLTLHAANGSLSDADKQSIAQEISSLKESLVGNFNAKDESGRYLFSGTASDQPSIINSNGSYQVGGNSDKRVVPIGNGINMEANVTATEMLAVNGTNILSQLDNLLAELEAPTANFATEIETTLAVLDGTQANVLESITSIGGRHNNLDLMASNHSENQLFVDKVKSDIKQLDYAEASVKLSGYLSALEATQASYVKINELSLFDRL